MSNLKLTAEPGTNEIRMTRIIDAPREAVYKAFVDTKQIPEWWVNTRVDKNEVRVGGAWRYVTKSPDGKEMGFNGIFKEISPNWKLVSTFEFEPMAGHIMTQSVTFSDTKDGETLLSIHCVYASVEDRDGMLKSGMETGAEAGYARLEKFLKKA
jgi:uncharacterized protein YndB with AHSA1/START domain